MKKHLLANSGRFYKANLHVHTTVSDGQMTPEEIKRIYMEQGYSIVAFTDHEIMVPETHLSDESFLAITSTEISTNQRTNCDFCYTKTYHLNIYSPEPEKNCFNTFDRTKMWLSHSYDYITPEQDAMQYNRRYSVEDVNRVIQMANDEGCLVSYNHPVWSMQDRSDYGGLKGLWGIELYNTGCARNGYFDSAMPLDELLRQGERVFPLATDDAHLLRDCFGGFVMVNAKNLEYNEVFSALKRGDFYASCGPLLYEISIDGTVVTIKTSPVSFIGVVTDCRYLHTERSESDSISEVSFDMKGYFDHKNDKINEHRYIRVVICDEKGRYAYSPAYFEDKWE